MLRTNPRGNVERRVAVAVRAVEEKVQVRKATEEAVETGLVRRARVAVATAVAGRAAATAMVRV